MGFKSIASALFSHFRKPREKEDGREETQLGETSPYAKFMEAGLPPLPKPRNVDTNTRVLSSMRSDVAQKSGNQVRIKDSFLLENLNTKARTTVGLFFSEQGALLVRNPNSGKVGRLIRWEGNTDHLPLFGDWTGGGHETLGFFDPKQALFYLWFGEEHKAPDLRFLYGAAECGWVPLVGDWDGDGKDGIGLYDPASGTFLLRNELSGGEPEIGFMYGPPGLGWIPLAGDWNGDGRDGVGIYDPLSGSFLLRNALSGGNHDISFRFMEAGPDWIPLVGDWIGDGADSVGIYDSKNRTFRLCNQVAGNRTDLVFQFGPIGIPGMPLTLRWVV